MKNFLSNLGLSEEDTAVYLAILELGQANVLGISQKSAVPRATVYGILNRLGKEKLINSVVEGKRRYYFTENPQKIADEMEKRKQDFTKILPKLLLIHSQAIHRPIIRAFEGAEGFKSVLEEMLTETPEGGSYDILMNFQDEIRVIGEKHFFWHVEKRVRKKISVRMISEWSTKTKEFAEKVKKELRQIRFAPKGQHFSISYHIYGDKVAMFSMQRPIVGVVIENKEIADMERLQFEYMWKVLK